VHTFLVFWVQSPCFMNCPSMKHHYYLPGLFPLSLCKNTHNILRAVCFHIQTKTFGDDGKVLVYISGVSLSKDYMAQLYCPSGLITWPSITPWQTMYSKESKCFWNRYNAVWSFQHQPISGWTMLAIVACSVWELVYQDIWIPVSWSCH